MADAAAVALGDRVGLQVGAQVGPVGERLVAQVAAVRLLARVRAHVALQEPGTRESLAADGADV